MNKIALMGLMAAALAVGLYSCGGGTGTDAGTTADAGADAGTANTVPAALSNLESNAEDCGENAAAGDWTTAVSIAAEASTSWTTAKAAVTAKGAKAETITAIDNALAGLIAAITSKDSRAAQTSANAISLSIPDLYDLYDNKVPSDVLRLDASFRLLQIDASFSDWTASSTDLGRVKDVWARLKPVAEPQAAKRQNVTGASTVIADIDTAISDAQAGITAQDSTATTGAAQKGLDLVDVVEKVFE